MLEINSKNIIGWLKLIYDVYPFNEEDSKALNEYIRRTDIIRRKKELEEIFGGDEQWQVQHFVLA